MPHRQRPARGVPKKSAVRRVSAVSYQALENRRTALLARLSILAERCGNQSVIKNAKVLLNDRFRAAKLAQRAAVLEAATWLIDVIELNQPLL
jgi:hypothetical protein